MEQFEPRLPSSGWKPRRQAVHSVAVQIVSRTIRCNDLAPQNRGCGHGGGPFLKPVIGGIAHRPSPRLRPKNPIDAAVAAGHAGDMAAELLLEGRRLRHELEAETVVDHGKATGGEREALAVCAGDILTRRGRVERLAGLGGELFAESFDLPTAQLATSIQPSTAICSAAVFSFSATRPSSKAGSCNQPPSSSWNRSRRRNRLPPDTRQCQRMQRACRKLGPSSPSACAG